MESGSARVPVVFWAGTTASRLGDVTLSARVAVVVAITRLAVSWSLQSWPAVPRTSGPDDGVVACSSSQGFPEAWCDAARVAAAESHSTAQTVPDTGRAVRTISKTRLSPCLQLTFRV